MPKAVLRVFKRAFMIAALLSIFSIVALMGAIWMGAESMIHPKRRSLEPRHLDVIQNPRDYGLELQPFETLASDGVVLRCILAERHPNPGTAERTRRMTARLSKLGLDPAPTTRGTVVFLHGRGGLKENMLTVAQRFVAADYRCIVYDARAHGQSEGTVSTFGHLEKGDLSRVIDCTEKLLQKNQEETGPVFAFGLSLGAAVLLQAVNEEPRITAAIAVAPFADLEEQILFTGRKQTFQQLPKWIPLAVTSLGANRAGFRSGWISPVRSASGIDRPVFVVHGTKDGVIPIDQARRIYSELRHPDKRWKEVPNGFHGNVLAEGGDDLYQEMIEFCLEHTRETATIAVE